VNINIPAINHIMKLPRPHPSAGEVSSPPLGGDDASAQRVVGADVHQKPLVNQSKWHVDQIKGQYAIRKAKDKNRLAQVGFYPFYKLLRFSAADFPHKPNYAEHSQHNEANRD
jgi:hypothetical protein